MSNNLELSIRISAELAELRKGLQTVRDEIRNFANSATAAGRQTENAIGGAGSAIAQDIKQGTAAAKNDLHKLEDEAKRAGKNSGRAFEPLQNNLTSLTGSIRSLLTGLATLATVRYLADQADQAALLAAKLNIATNSTEELAAAQQALFDIAQRTRTPFAATVDLYSKLQKSSKELTATQGQLFDVTETVNKAIQLSGVSAESADAALMQLSQGLASGTLRGDELNSVMEQTPRLAQAIADGMGISVGQLRKMGEQGKITAEVVINALLKQKQTLDDEFAKLPPTIGSAFTQLKNSITVFIGEVDKATGTSRSFAGVIQDLANTLGSTDFIAGFVEEFTQINTVIGQTLDDVNSLIDTFTNGVKDQLGGKILADESVAAFKDMPANIRAFLQLATVEVAAFVDRVANRLQRGKERFKAIFTDDTWDAANKRFEERAKVIEETYNSSVTAILAERDATLLASKAAADKFKQERAAREQAAKAARNNPDNANAVTSKKPKDMGSVDAIAAAKTEAEGALQTIEALFSAGLINLETYYDEKRRLVREIGALEIQEIDKKLEKESDAEKRSTLLTKRAEAERKNSADIVKINLEEYKAKADLDKKRLDDNAQLQRDLLTAEGKGAEARILDLQRRYAEMLKVIGDNPQNRAVIDRIIDLERAKDRLQELQKVIDEAVRQQKDKEQEIGQRKQAGDPTADEALNASRAVAIEQLKQYRAELEILAQQGVPGAADSLKKLDEQMKETSKTVPTGMQKIAISATEALKGGLEDFFTSIATGSKSASEALRDMARSFVQQMAIMAAKALAMYAILLLLNSIPGGSAVAEAMGIGAKVKHTGGMVGAGGTIRQVNPALFAAAPRYHSGGVAGLKPGEVPAILQTGEEVLARNDPRNAMNGGGQAQQGGGTRIINVIDPNLVSDYMTSSSGEQTILNVLQRNAGSVRQILG